MSDHYINQLTTFDGVQTGQYLRYYCSFGK